MKQLRTLFAPPVFPEDEDKTRKARYANAISLTFIIVALGYEVAIRITRGYLGLGLIDIVLFAIAFLLSIGLILLRRGFLQLTSILLVGLIWTAINGVAASGFGIRDSSYITNLAVILMAGLLLGWQASVVVTVLSILSGFGLAYAEQNGLIKTVSYPPASFAQDMTFVLSLNAVLIYLLINGLESAVRRAQANSKELQVINVDLARTQGDLQARGVELLSANQQLEKRSERLRAVADVARTAVSLQNLDRLLASITHIISNQLGYYHVAIFLVDEQGQHAILRSANTDGGLRMLARGYRLQVGQEGVIGNATRTGQPRIAQNIDSDFLPSPDPDLSETRSELALPLKVGETLIGVLDIQAKEVAAFTADDVSALSILADQVAIAIQNARLYEQAQRALRDAEIASSQALGQAWKGYNETIHTRGYRYDGIKPEPLTEPLPSSNENGTLLRSVQLRGQMIGRLQLKPSDPTHQWTEDELAILEATAERVAIALESNRLLEEAQRRAVRESFLSDIAAKLGASFKLDSILRDTVQELGQTLKESVVSFQLVDPQKRSSAALPKANGNSARQEKSE
jgi:GAF domain-containing protein